MTSLMSEPGSNGRFGDFGGRFVPESLMPACLDLEQAFKEAWADPAFHRELDDLLVHYGGRPTPVTQCRRLSEKLGVRVLLKREDLAHTGSHKINNVVGQALLTRRMGKTRIIAETGAGQHGVASATAAALFGLECTVFMGEVDTKRQELNVFRMELLGAEVRSVTSGSRTLKDAVNEAMREWVASVEHTHYCLGSVMGPHPFPYMVREFQRVVGDEARGQCRTILDGADPDVVVACIGGGSNAAGTFAGFVDTGRGWLVSRQPAVPPSPTGSRACCTACIRSSCRTRRARFWRPSRSRPDSTIPDWVPSTPTWPPSVGPSTTPPTMPRSSKPSSCCPTPRASFPHSSRRMPWPGWPAPPGPPPCPKDPLSSSPCRGGATRTWRRCARSSGAPVLELEASLRAARDGGKKLLIPYLMGGMTDDWEQSLAAVVAAGADAVEVGIPFSDPMMDGPVIQEAALAALQRGIVPDQVLDGISRAEAPVPVAVMTYYNIVFRAGHKRMANALMTAGVSAAIIPDLSLEEIAPWAEEADAAGIETVLLVAPSSPEDRVARLCARARGFVYAVARMGVTGERADLGDEARQVVERIRRHTDMPVCVGVGVSTPAQAVEVCEVADGVVVGSALVRRLLAGGGPEAAAEFVGTLRRAID